jgi:hypothetical protein
MDPVLFLDDKTKEKALKEEMKKKYGTQGDERHHHQIINNVATQLGTKILACKLLRKCHREEVPAGVITVAAQCAEGTSMSWVPYLLKLFLEECKDA